MSALRRLRQLNASLTPHRQQSTTCTWPHANAVAARDVAPTTIVDVRAYAVKL
eukprot:COSAG03_NODE_21137_length_308_cov_1.239234_1_plen_52_part_10